MSRLTGSDALGLFEAYQTIYSPQELTEEQVWEEVENWVNTLIEEGYDLSDYTWEEMYEAYLSEAPVVPSMDQMVKKGFQNQKFNQGFSKAATQLLGKPGQKPAAATPARPTAPARPAARPAATAPAAPRPAATAPAAPRPAATAPAAPARPAATAPAAKPAGSAMDQWAKANPRLAQAQQIRKEGGSRAEVNKALYNKGTAAATSTPTVVKAGFDLFDVVIGHLLDEGYADTEESALAIMVNMSEEWRESIIEERAPGVRPYKPGKPMSYSPLKPLSGEKGDRSGYGDDTKFTQDTDAKSFKPGKDVPKVKKFGRISRSIPHGIGDHANKTQSRVSTIVRKDPGAPKSQKLPPPEKKKPSREIVRRNKDTNESYDIILSHLIDEGYANSVEAAESIMVSMSEDWVSSIIG